MQSDGKQNLYKGAFGVVPEELDNFESTSDIPAFDVDISCNPEWIYYFFKQNDFYKSLIKYATGTGSRRIQPDRLFKEKIPLPSRDIQDEIIKKIKIQETFYCKLNNNLENNINNIKNLRKVILSKALQGKLISQNQNDEPAFIILEKIKKEKERLIKEKIVSKVRPLPAISKIEIPYEIPNEWQFIRLGDYFDLKTGATPSTSISEYWDGDIKWLKSGDVNLGEIYDCEGRISEQGMKNSNCKLLPIDSVLIALNGQGKTRATSAMLRVEATCNQSIIAMVSYDKTRLIPEYLWIYLKANYMKIREITGHKQRRGLNMKIISLFIVPIPPTNEQKRIIKKINQLMKLCDDLEEQIKENQKNAELLMDAVIREAFENN